MGLVQGGHPGSLLIQANQQQTQPTVKMAEEKAQPPKGDIFFF